MDPKKKDVYFVAVVLAATLAGGGYFAYRNRTPPAHRVEAHIKTWYEAPRQMARLMTERYGPPSALGTDDATWHERGPWKRIVVHGDSPDSCLEQVVAYWVSPEAGASLREFGHGVQFDYAAEEMSTRSNDESLNFLALNLANQIASGSQGAEEARQLYTRTATLALSGKSSPYMQKLLFGPNRPAPKETWRRGIDY